MLPASESDVLITLSKVLPSGAAQPVARSYDGHSWEDLAAAPLPPAAAVNPTTFALASTYDRASSQLEACALTGSPCEVLLPDEAPCLFRLDRYNATAAAGYGAGAQGSNTTQQLASRLLLQGTFGPTRALLDGPLGTDMSTASVRAWIGEQASLPATSLRAYMRRATNPRIRPDLEGTLAGRTRPACSVGSRWHRFAFNSEDEDKIVRIASQGDNTLVLSVEGEVRTELSLPNNYTIVTAGKCGVFSEHITSPAECLAAAHSLGLSWRRSSDEARDDNKNAGDTSRPRGCYLLASLGQPLILPVTSAEYLNVNVNDGNVRACSMDKICICKRALNVSAGLASPPQSPPAPPPPPALPGFTDPTQCDGSLCCVVIFEGPRGAQCNPVPIWDFASWVHPGGPFVAASALCGTVRYDWLSRNGNHGGDARPEDLGATQFAGGAIRVGTFVEPTCVAPPNGTVDGANASEAYVICSVEESVGGLVEMVRYDPSLVLADNEHPCSSSFLSSTSDWYSLSNPAIALSAPEPSISQQFNASEVVLSPLAFGNGPSDAYLLESAPPSCTLSEQTSAYMRVGGTMWVRHDRRLELTNCTGTCRLKGRAEHPYTLTNESFGGVDKTLSEAANEPAVGHRFNVWLINEAGFRTYMPFWHDRNDAKMMAWTSTVLGCADQLRHRVAFALSQVFVVGEAGLDKAEEYEVYASYYDIFVRNAFGSYYDVLREVAYSPAMAHYLSFHNNRAFASRGNLPDENFAREIMQLFSIGLYALRDDGTLERDAAGELIATYDNDDIMNFARVWTGFTRQTERANIMRGKEDYDNYVDPNTIMVDDRDTFPKIDLYDQYLGDGHPLCADLPARSFLRAGARYRRTFDAFLATGRDWLSITNAPAIALGANSSLSRALCGGDQQGDAPLYGDNVSLGHGCAFADKVELSADLPCDGDECLVAEAYMVQLTVGSPSANLSFTYEFLRPPCVDLTFHAPMERVRSELSDETTCVEATPEMHAALSDRWEYLGSGRCVTVLRVGATDGWVGFDPPNNKWIPGMLHKDVVNYFPVRWQGGVWPTPQNNCSATVGAWSNNASGCVVDGDGCYCEQVDVVTSAVFTNASEVPTAAEVEAALSIGAPRPSDFGEQLYSLCASPACSAAWPSVRIYTHANASGQLDERAIFEIELGGAAAFFVNKESTVYVGGFSLRNPPHFMSFRTPLARDAMYETEALLHHLMHHRNTAPFVAYRLIQRLVTSNPSPRYIKVVADAFRTGTHDGVRYAGGYGSLAATVHAILLDREARSPTLDLDPSHGQLREPLLRVVHVMRSMEYTSYDGRDPELHDMMQKVGQQVFQSPGVFNFFKPEYQALGPIIGANLVAPEFEISTTPAILGFVNGASSLVRYGLTGCRSGFGLDSRLQPRTGGDDGRYCSSPARLTQWRTPDGQSLDVVSLKGALDGSSSDGVLSFSPRGAATDDAAQVVAELDLLLTAGRLSDVSRRVIEDEYARLLVEGTYLLANEDGTNCSHWGGEVITTVEECEAAARALNKTSDQTAETGSFNWKPVGCYYDNSDPEELKLNDNSEPTKRGLCSGNHDCLCRVRGASIAMKRAVELLTLTPDFVATNRAQPAATPRVAPSRPASGGRTYKALVVLFLEGGADSWNLIVPHSGCVAGNESANYLSYATLRGGEVEGVALRLEDLLPIDVGASQPCSHLGVHPRLTSVQRLYQEGDAAFLTNVGTLVEPMSKAEYLAKEKRRPPSLFAHNVQVKVTQSMHPQDSVATGVMGRIADVLGRSGGSSPAYRTGSYSLDGMPKMLEGERGPVVLDKGGVVSFEHQAELQEAINNITLGGNASYKSLFGETWAQQLQDALSTSQTLGAATSGVSLTASFPSETLGQQFEQVARTVAARDNLEEERQLFFVKLGGFDTHSSLKDQVDEKFVAINAALEAFEVEMKAQGVWQDTVLLTASDFGRTYATNGAGTDHAWGGNYFVAGGAVNGSQLFGDFPSSFIETGDVVISRNGRIIPTTPWEAVWHALAEWLGVEASSMGEVLPNFANFPFSSMLRASATDGWPGLIMSSST